MASNAEPAGSDLASVTKKHVSPNPCNPSTRRSSLDHLTIPTSHDATQVSPKLSPMRMAQLPSAPLHLTLQTGSVVVDQHTTTNESKTQDQVVYIDGKQRDWTQDHMRLLYLISKYSHAAVSAQEQETWIRRLPLLVLIYEGVIRGAFAYDYAPASEFVGHEGIWMNVSQEGADDIDDLREGGLVNGLKLSTKASSNVTAFQISLDGAVVLKDFIRQHPQGVEFFTVVDAFIHSDETKEQISVDWDSGKRAFMLTTKSGSAVRSGVMDCEDVSYVSSPYLPACLLPSVSKDSSVFASNAHRKHEAYGGKHNIQEEVNELIHLDNVHILIGEWIPFGENQILALNDKLGSTERVQGGLFTGLVDSDPSTTNFECSPGLTSVRIVDFDLFDFLAFQAEIYFPEDPGIVQVEHFGMAVHANGDTHYGLRLECVLNNDYDNISLDHLARVLMDIRQDSSKIIDSLISAYQRTLLDVVFLGGSENRPKFNVLIADGMSPALTAEQCMDKEGYENEIKQVIGDTHSAYDIAQGELLVIGRHGIMLVGKECRRHEDLLVQFLSLSSASLFMQSIFRRTFALRSRLRTIREMIDDYESDPNSIPRIRMLHSSTEKEVILMSELLSYLQESVQGLAVPERSPAPQADEDAGATRLRTILGAEKIHSGLVRRVADMAKNLESARNELRSLAGDLNVITENRMFTLQEEVQSNTKNLEDVFRSNERASTSLDVLQLILAGSLAFEILDRLTGDWSVVEHTWAQSWIVQPLMMKPFVWFCINMSLWLLIGLMLLWLKHVISTKSNNVLVVRMKLNKSIDMRAMERYLKSKPIQEESVDFSMSRSVRKVHWEETDVAKYDGLCPTVEVQFDSQYGFLLSASFTVQKPPEANRRAVHEDRIRNMFFRELAAVGVLSRGGGHVPLLSAISDREVLAIRPVDSGALDTYPDAPDGPKIKRE